MSKDFTLIYAGAFVLTAVFNIFGSLYTSFSALEIALVSFPAVWCFCFILFRAHYNKQGVKK